jgi:hypothetical protein
MGVRELRVYHMHFICPGVRWCNTCDRAEFLIGVEVIDEHRF